MSQFCFSPLLVLLVICVLPRFVSPIKCYVGYGQRGLEYSNGISWERTCPNTDYCFEVISFDIEKVQKLINFPWNSYYNQFYIRSCGGDLGTQTEYRPYRGMPRSFRALGNVKINITVDKVITGHGGTEEFYLKHACRKDLCTKGTSSSASRLTGFPKGSSFLLPFAVVIFSIFMTSYSS